MSEESAVDEADQGATDRSGNMTSTAAIVLVVAAVGLAGWAALRPPSTAARDAAVAKACTAFDVVRTGVDLNTSTLATGGPGDAAEATAVAVNARLSLLGGGQYLMSRIDPATPRGLASEVRNFANTLMDIGATSIAGSRTTDPQQVTRLQDAQALSITVNTQCVS